MTKLDFLFALRDKLTGLPKEELEERLRFYSEMIEDRMEEGLSEEEAVASIGTVDEITEQLSSDIPAVKPSKKLKSWEIILIALGFPIWFSLLIAAFAVVISLYASAWAVVISLWAAFGAVVSCAFGGVVAGIGFILSGHSLPGFATIAASIVCAGCSVFLFYGCKALTKGLVLITKKCFARKEKS